MTFQLLGTQENKTSRPEASVLSYVLSYSAFEMQEKKIKLKLFFFDK
jgi:hypothetical protein